MSETETQHPQPNFLPLAIRLVNMHGRITPMLCCAESGRPLDGVSELSFSASARNIKRDVLVIRADAEIYVRTETAPEGESPPAASQDDAPDGQRALSEKGLQS